MSDKTKIIFLGTGASTPTKERNLSSIALRFGGEWMLFDCPEGTQKQMMHAKVSYLKINHVFLSHFHADHILGLGGLLATMNIHGRDWSITVHGPKGVKEKVDSMLKLAMLKPGFEVKCEELKEGEILKEKNYSVEAIKLQHEVETYGFIFKEKDKEGEFNRKKAIELGIPIGPLFSELQKGKTIRLNGKEITPEQVMDKSKKKKGKKISIIFDTLPLKNTEKIKESDLLIHEASFLEKMKERAKETTHSTARQAAQTAEKTGAKKLILFHLSARHKENEQIENEARAVFAKSIVAKDLMEIEL